MKKTFITVAGGVTLALNNAIVQATSYLPTGALDNLVTDSTDTAKAAVGGVFPAMIGVTLVLAAIGLSRRAMSKGGVK